MRPAHDEVLEPLPVERPAPGDWDDGWRDAWDVHRAGIALLAPAPLQRQSSATFTRLTTVNPALLAGLPDWWCARAHDDRVRATRRLELDPPQRDGSGTWRMFGRLRGPGLRRPIGVELQLWPRLGAWTKVTMQPQRRVRVGRRYFRAGHRALDALSERLESELRVTPR